MATEPDLSPDAHGAPELTRLASTALRQLARLYILHGQSFGDLREVARSEFCRAAEEHIEALGQRPSDSRVAILTGLTRADVARTLRADTPPVGPDYYRLRTDRVLHGWRSDPQFTDENGLPRRLSFKGPASFESLCRQYSGDIPARAVLEELCSREAVVVEERNLVRRLTGSRTPAVPFAFDESTATLAHVFRAYHGGVPNARATTLAVDFPAGRVPRHVIRTVRQRVERFLSGLASYLHEESRRTETAYDASAGTATFTLVTLEDETPDRPAHP